MTGGEAIIAGALFLILSRLCAMERHSDSASRLLANVIGSLSAIAALCFLIAGLIALVS